MKKLIVIGAVLTALSAPAFAKTEGAYVGADILYSKSSHKYKNSQNQVSSYYGTFDDSEIGYGANLKYAFNFNKIFIAPAIFADKIGTEAKDRDGDNVSINHRYGAKLDFSGGGTLENGGIVSRGIIEEMKESYLDYAMSVIASRALPDVRDGLKPVHR